MPNPDFVHRMLLIGMAAAMLLLAACSRAPADPVASAVAIAEERCECTRKNAPSVARCVNQASKGLNLATASVDDGPTKTAMVRAYEDTFGRCPWDDPSYYR